MSDKKTYQQDEQIRRYLQNEMNSAERNAFERQMQKDPFLAEAVDGLSAFYSEEIFTDIQLLKAKIQKSNRSNRRYIWYAAASVLVIVVSTFLLFNLEEKTNPVLTENVVKVESGSPKKVIPEPQNLQKNETEQKKNAVPQEEVKVMEDELEIADTEADKAPIVPNIQNGVSPDLAEQKQLKKAFAINENLEVTKFDTSSKNRKSAVSEDKFLMQKVSADEIQVAKPALAKQKAMPAASESTRMLSLDSKADTALNEVVVIGCGTRQEKSVTGAVAVPETSARTNGKAIPVNGWDAYNEYLSTELQHPKTGSPTKKVVVRLSFVVDETGKPGSFNILHSDDNNYNDEAIRIIENGPGWISSVKNSIPKCELVKLRLVFPAGKY